MKITYFVNIKQIHTRIAEGISLIFFDPKPTFFSCSFLCFSSFLSLLQRKDIHKKIFFDGHLRHSLFFAMWPYNPQGQQSNQPMQGQQYPQQQQGFQRTTRVLLLSSFLSSLLKMHPNLRRISVSDLTKRS